MATHHQDGGVEQGALGAEHSVGNKRRCEAGKVDQPTVGAHDGGGRGLVHSEATTSHLVVHVVDDDRLHAVEGEALPHLDTEEVGEATWLPEERFFFCRARRGVCHVLGGDVFLLICEV